MAKFNMSRLRRLITGEYMDQAGNIITKNRELTPEARKYLVDKYSTAHADRVNWNTRSGNVYQNNRWRADDPSTGQRTQQWELAIKNTGGKKTFEDWVTGKTTYFNQSDKDADLAKKGGKSTLAKKSVKEDSKTDTSKQKSQKQGYFEEAVKLNPTFVIRELNKDSQKTGKDLNQLKKQFYKDENGIIYYKSSADNKPHYINDHTTMDDLNGYSYNDLYRINRMANSPYIKLQGLPVEGTKWLWNEAIVPGTSWLWNEAIVPGAEWAWDDVIVPGSKGVYNGGKWFFGLDRKGGKLEKFKKGGSMFRTNYIRKGENGLTATYTKTKDNDYYLKHNLNKRGKYNNLSWKDARNNALNDPKYAKLRQELETYGKQIINNNWSLNNASTDEIQRLMVGYADNGNYQFDKNIFNTKSNFVDNRWGSQTQSAWEHLNNAVNTGEKNNPSPITITNQREYKEAIPNYSAWDYSKGVDNLGFNDYAGLVNFVRGNADNGFAKDLIHRFGAVDTWKQADIENALGVRGRYGKGFLGSGDYADMLRSMATWAGENDAKYNYRANPDTLVNRSQTRQILRELGFNPYSFTGAERRALRMHLNNNTGYNPLQRIKQGIGNILLNRNANTLTQNEADFLQKQYPQYFKPAKSPMEEAADYVSQRINSPQVAKRGMKLPSRNVVERFRESRSFRQGEV